MKKQRAAALALIARFCGTKMEHWQGGSWLSSVFSNLGVTPEKMNQDKP